MDAHYGRNRRKAKPDLKRSRAVTPTLASITFYISLVFSRIISIFNAIVSMLSPGMSTCQEGVTIDVVVPAIRRIMLNPYINVPIAILLSSKEALPLLQLLGIENPSALLVSLNLTTLASVLLSLNDYLNKQIANNWLSDPKWDWDKEIVLVTGGSSGIGASISRGIIARNRRTRIVVVDIAPLSWEPGPGALLSYYQCDLSDPKALRDTCSRIQEEVGDPTVLFNNAGLVRGTSILYGSAADVEITVRTNLIAPFLLIKEFLPAMVRNDHGHIIHTGSLATVTPPAMIADYSATKAGLVALHESLQLELKTIYQAPRVRLTLCVFGFVQTPLIKGFTNVPNFIAPFLHADSVGAKLVDAVYSGYGSTIYMPTICNLMTALKGGPYWIFHLIREATAIYRIDYRGRQKLDQETGKLLI